jgi:hypothetical protein
MNGETEQEPDAIWDALPREERLKILQAHLDDMVSKGELISAVVDGETRYFSPRNYEANPVA